jgi:hypothetical protein
MIAFYAIVTFISGFFVGSSIDSQAYVANIQGSTITLEQKMHSLPGDWWNGNFELAAKYHCGDFEVLEKTSKPSTMSGSKVKDDAWYWVVHCK